HRHPRRRRRGLAQQEQGAVVGAPGRHRRVHAHGRPPPPAPAAHRRRHVHAHLRRWRRQRPPRRAAGVPPRAQGSDDPDRGAAAGALRRARVRRGSHPSLQGEVDAARGLDQRRLLRRRAGRARLRPRRRDVGARADGGARRRGAALRLPPRRVLAVHGHAARPALPGIAVGRRPRAMEDMVTQAMANPLARYLDEALDRNRAMWQELRGARVFLTGGSGVFGCWLRESLLWANDRLALDTSIVALTRDADAFANKAPHLTQHPSVRLVSGDVRSPVALPGRFTHVVHAAADGRPIQNREDRLRMFDTIVGGTRRMLEMAREAGAGRFLLTSSGAVYGPQPPSLPAISEDYAGSP